MATKKRLIDATPIIDECKECSVIEWNKSVYTTWAEAEEDFMQRLLDAPIVDTVEVVHGRWVDRYGGKYDNQLFECSECKRKALCEVKVDALGHEHVVQVLSDFCPHCGIDMRGDDND